MARSLARHERFTFHFTPTSCSWLNAVEGFFAKRRLKRGVFRSVADLQTAINRFLDEHNDEAKPFSWTADPDKIIAAVRRGHQALNSIHWRADGVKPRIFRRGARRETIAKQDACRQPVLSLQVPSIAKSR